jgi:hypothetical protein
MPRYFFNVHSGPDTFIDREGEELPDRHAAWSEATKSAGLSLRDLDGKLEPGTEWRMDVLDAAGRRLFCLTVSAFSDN